MKMETNFWDELMIRMASSDWKLLKVAKDELIFSRTISDHPKAFDCVIFSQNSKGEFILSPFWYDRLDHQCWATDLSEKDLTTLLDLLRYLNRQGVTEEVLR